MSVDRFGRSTNGTSTAGGTSTYISGGSGLTITQFNNNLLRRDGQNDATTDNSFTSHHITNPADPTLAQHAAIKSYVDFRAKVPSARFQKPSGTGKSEYSWADFDVIP